jgi:hypothetical protein
MQTYKNQARCQNHGDTCHMDANVDDIVVVCAILLHISGSFVGEVQVVLRSTVASPDRETSWVVVSCVRWLGTRSGVVRWEVEVEVEMEMEMEMDRRWEMM